MTASPWLRGDGEPRWGHPDGIQVGLHPLGGPRGLLRIYTPYLAHASNPLINFIAVEPIPAGRTERGYSELEHSALDGVRGKRMWPLQEAGTLEIVEGAERLFVDIDVERFDNGADVRVRVTFCADRPHEFAVAAYRNAGSAELDACVLSATMGNFARLRRLQLRDRVVVVSATPDEDDPWSAVYDPDPLIEARVNGRRAYWASESAIQGGTAYENVELVEPFRDGRALVLEVEPLEITT
jgi:hypothetical protein